LVREAALGHLLDSADIAAGVGSRDVSLWFADGSNYPGTANMRHRRKWFAEGLAKLNVQAVRAGFLPHGHRGLGHGIAAGTRSGSEGEGAGGYGPSLSAQKIEQIVAWLLEEDMLGGFHLNDRRYADDDLTMGSINPHQVFRIFHEIAHFEWETGKRADIAYMVDQSHNLKGKIEAMVQTVTTAQELSAKAALVDHNCLADFQNRSELIDAENCLKDAFSTDVRPAIRDWARRRGLPEDPLTAFRQSGYLERITAERREKNAAAVSSYA
jgi:L-rhamnose isomerase/sugar isomerase